MTNNTITAMHAALDERPHDQRIRAELADCYEQTGTREGAIFAVGLRWMVDNNKYPSRHWSWWCEWHIGWDGVTENNRIANRAMYHRSGGAKNPKGIGYFHPTRAAAELALCEALHAAGVTRIEGE